MKIAGIIAEYNPFHNGHKYHIEETRRLTGCDYVVVCMNGAITQRGELVLTDRRSRAEAALRNGADAVFDLPALFAVRTADVFAASGVHILSSLGCDYLSFGCESTDETLLQRLCDLREEEPEVLTSSIHAALAEGKSQVRARGEAISELLGIRSELLNSPNLILGTEYVYSIRKSGSHMKPIVVPRIGSYNDISMNGRFASASAIRKSPNSTSVSRFVPKETLNELEKGHFPRDPDDILLYLLRTMKEADIACLPDVCEGLENRVSACARSATSRTDLIETVKCKRYTYARISRLCAHALLGITKDLVMQFPRPEYARLIGMRTDAGPLLSELNRRTTLPMVSRVSELNDNRIFDIECAATDLRALCMDLPELRRAGREQSNKLLTV